MKNKMNIKPILAMALIVVLTMSLAGCSTVTETTGPLQIQTEVASKSKISSSLQLSGVLLPNETINVSAMMSGTVTKAPVNIGDTVKVGDVLLEMDTKTLDAQIEQAKAGLASAQSAYASAKNQIGILQTNYDAAKDNYDHTKSLYDSGVVSETQFNGVETQYNVAKKQLNGAKSASLDQAEAAINSAKASIHTLEVQKENAVVTAPINGILLSKNIQMGELASPGVPLFSIADLSVLTMKGTVSQEYIPFIKVGQTLNLKVDIYPNKIFKGTVKTLGPISVSTGKLFPIEVQIKNDEHLMAGFTARASIEINGNSNILVANKAVIYAEGESYVFVIENNIAVKNTVITGLSNKNQVEILSGISEDDVIAVSNIRVLQDQMPVSTKQ